MRILGLFIAICLCTGALYAQDLSSILKDVEARYSRFEKEIQDMTILQETRMTTPGGEMAQNINLQTKGKKFRMESNMQMPEGSGMPGGMQTITIYDGKDIWMISPFTGKQKMPEISGRQYQVERNWWDYISSDATIVGSEVVSGKDCYIITVKEEAPFNKLWLDKNSLIMVKAEFKGAGNETMLLVYSNFRKVMGDWEMPYKTEMYQGDKLFSTAITKSIEINKGLTDELFNPDMVKVPSMEEMTKQMMQR